MLEVDEVEPHRPCEARRGDEVVAQPVQLVVGQHPDALGKAPVEPRMAVGHERLRDVIGAALREPA